MNAIRLATTTLVVLGALTCDRTPEATESRDAEAPPAISRIVAQTIVESDSPREAHLALAAEPLVRVGLLDGPDEYLFSNIGTERYHYGGGDSGPVTWGKDMAFAVTGTGVWYGSADDYELEHVDWNGHITRIARWAGPDLEVTSAHLDRYLSAYLARYDTPAERRSFERERWPGIRDDLPERFPAYESDGLLALPDGSVWVTTYTRWAPRKELNLLDPDGLWVRRATIPARSTLLDAGVDWVLLLERGQFDEQSVAVYELVEGS